MNEQEESRNPFDVPREEWTIDDRANALRQGNYVTRLKTWAIADAGIFDVAQIAKQRLDSLCWSTETETACVCEGGLFMNPEFFDSMTLPQANFVLMHEAMHVAMRHLPRFKTMHPEISNAACDLAINWLLCEWADKVTLKPSVIWPFDKAFERPKDGMFVGENEYSNFPINESAEEYYKLLMQMIKQMTQQRQQGCGNPQNQPCNGGQGNQQNQQQNQQGQQQGQQDQNGQGGQQQGQQQGGGAGQGGDDGEQDPNEGIDPSIIDALNNLVKQLGIFKTKSEDAAMDSQMQDIQEALIERARAAGKKDIETFTGQTKKITGGLTQKQYDDHCNHPETKDGQKSEGAKKARVTVQAGQGVAERGVDGLVDRTDDEAMWNDLLEPLRITALTDEKAYSHKEFAKVAVALGIGGSVGEDVFLEGRVEGHTVGGEVLFIVDTSGSTMDYWQLSVAKAIECLASMENNSIMLRVILFSSGVSLNNEYIFYNKDTVDDEMLKKDSVLFPGKQVMEEHIVDVSPWLDLTHVEVKELVGSKIVGGGGTELLPIVQHIQNTVGEDVSERFDVTIILTDAELCGNEMNWAESQQVFEVFGEHVSWIFLDLYNANYSAIQGEKKYLITCGRH